MSKRFLPTITLIILVLTAISGCGSKVSSPESEDSSKIAVMVVRPGFSPYQETLDFPGVTDAPEVTRVGFLVAGKVDRMNYSVGQKVRAGQIMAKLDPKSYQAQVKSAAAQVVVSGANLAKVKAGARDQEIAAAKNQMLQAKAACDHAWREFKRYKAVYLDDAISKQQFDSARTQYEQAKEQYNAASQNYSLVKEGASPQDKGIARANVSLASAGLDQARLQLEYTTLKSPLTGVISAKLVEVGTVVNAGTPVYEIRTRNHTDFVINVPSTHVGKMTPGRKALVTFMETPGKGYPATVYEVAPVSDAMTRAYQVKLRMEKFPAGRNLSGVIGNAIFHLGQPKRVTTVPVSCLQKKQDGPGFYVFTIKDGDTALKVDAELVKVVDENAIISAQVSNDARIVVSGQEYLKEGSPVRIVKALNSYKFVTRDKVPPRKDYPLATPPASPSASPKKTGSGR